MTKIILRAMNPVILLILVVIGISIQTSLFASYPFLYLQPDIVLLTVIWCAMNRSFEEGGILTLILSNITEIHSGAPKGIYFISYMAVYLLLRSFSRYLVIRNLSRLIGLTLFTSILWKLLTLFLLILLNEGHQQWRHTVALLLPGAVMEGVVGIWVFRWLERFDWVTFKHPRAQKALDDEIKLEEEGL